MAPLYERVPPELYGGTERIVGCITEELVSRGHDVTLFASGDSRTNARLAAPTPRALRLASEVQDQLAPHVLELAQVFEQADRFDVIHSHLGYLAFPQARMLGAPCLHTLHGRLDLPDIAPVFRHFREQPLVSISDAQRAPFEPLGVNWAGTVYHGLPLDAYPLGRGEGRYLAFLGRISPEKRPDLAINLARRVGVPLRIAAKVDPADEQYFEREIEPLLAGDLVEYIGEIGDESKAKFLGDALALVFPIDWPEPFGLVMIEALACGTPVIARPCGSVPEVIVQGQTGFIADSLDEMAEAVARIDRIDRAACRQEAVERFSVERMVDDYEALYRQIGVERRAA